MSDKNEGFKNPDGSHVSGFHVGDSVIATPKDGDFEHGFEGVVNAFRDGNVVVVDGDGDAYECEPSQLVRSSEGS